MPYIDAPKGDPARRYYFCARFMVPATVYLPYLITTKDVPDAKVDDFVTDTLTQEDMLLSMRLGDEPTNRVNYPNPVRKLFLDRCINKMRGEGLSIGALATLFSVSESTVRSAAAEVRKVVQQDQQPIYNFINTPEYEALKKEALKARVKASNMGLRYEFVLSDVLPTMYDIQGNSGRLNGELVVPKVCPVLRIPLDYDLSTNKRAQNKVRVWRKTPGPDGTAPMDKNNIIVMSAIATWAIEGAYGKKKISALSYEMQTALAEWQGIYGTRTVPREAKIGRPRKAP